MVAQNISSSFTFPPQKFSHQAKQQEKNLLTHSKKVCRKEIFIYNR